MSSTHFVYLHGFNSGYDPENEKIKHLENLGAVSGITYNTYGSHSQIKEFLLDRINHSDGLVLVGTSLGGYWASEIANYLKVPSILINPCYDPFTMLQKYEGIVNANYKTGHDNSLSQQSIDSYENKELSTDSEDFFYSPLILCDRGDAVISCSTVEQLYGESFQVETFQGGSHQFNHMEKAKDYIKNYLRICDFVEHI